MEKVIINLYKLEELEPEAREKAISEHGEFLINEFILYFKSENPDFAEITNIEFLVPNNLTDAQKEEIESWIKDNSDWKENIEE